MKLVIVLLLNLALAFSAFAETNNSEEELDATPTFESAKREALDYAYINIFSEFLDHDTSVTIRLKAESETQYIFKVKANNGWTVCSTIINVGKELGNAYQTDGEPLMRCKDLKHK